MYLTRLFLNPMSRAVQHDLVDVQHLHSRVMSGFPREQPDPDASSRMRHAVLYRLDAEPRVGRVLLYVQSKTQPDYTSLPSGYLTDLGGEVDNPATRPLDGVWETIANGNVYAFRLRANPTRKIDTKTGPDGKRRHGKRVDVRGDEGRLAWLQRKAQSSGFALTTVTQGDVSDVRVIEERHLSGRRMQKPLTFASVVYEGCLRVIDAEAFRTTLGEGIGSAKAYGFGLITLAPVPN